MGTLPGIGIGPNLAAAVVETFGSIGLVLAILVVVGAILVHMSGKKLSEVYLCWSSQLSVYSSLPALIHRLNPRNSRRGTRNN